MPRGARRYKVGRRVLDLLGAQHPQGDAELQHRQTLEEMSTRVLPNRTEGAQLSQD